MSPARQEPRPSLTAKMRRLEQQHAYEYCVTVLRAYCFVSGSSDLDFDTSRDPYGKPQIDETNRELITQAVQYLEWRGLLDREGSGVVTVLPESKGEVAA